ncbi:anaerobic sulfatase maturase, partial [Vibrio parahaemolyticus]
EYCKHAEAIYSFFRKNKVKHIQFSPLVESSPSETEQARGQHFGSNLIFSTDKRYTGPQKYEPIAWSVDAKEYGRFLTDVFHLWVSQD